MSRTESVTLATLYERVTVRQCVECGRVFYLDDEVDAGEWYYGHDCE
jgi:hypothetical protein